jgi:hypothetical protein
MGVLLSELRVDAFTVTNPMSLLRACSGALAKPALLRSSLVAHALSTEAAPPTPTATKESSEIVPIPQKDVLSADVISGAPGTTVPPPERNRAFHHTHNLKPNSVTALCVYTSPSATLCRAVARRGNAGVLTGISYLVVGVGRTR